MGQSTREYRKRLAELADRYHRDIVKGRRNHDKLICRRGDRPYVVVSSTTADTRAIKNIERDLRRADTCKAKRNRRG